MYYIFFLRLDPQYRPQLHSSVKFPLHFIKYNQYEQIKTMAFWDMTLSSLLEVYRYFRGMYCLHLQGKNVSQASIQQ
jgi:hypothetical protein